MNFMFQMYSLLLFGACVVPLPYVFPSNLWWLGFVLLVPLFCVVARYDLSWREGFWWGLVMFGIHTAPVLYGMFWFASGSYGVRLVVLMLIAIYLAVQSAVWFWLIRWMLWLTRVKTTQSRIALWAIMSAFFFVWIERFCFLPFGACDGYPLINPAILLMAHWYGRRLVMLWGMTGIVFLLAAIWFLVAMLCFERRGIWVALLVALFATGLWQKERRELPPGWACHLGVVQRQFHSAGDLLDTVHEMKEAIHALRKKYPQVEIVVFPESCVYETLLMTNPFFSCQWTGATQACMVGSFRWEGEACHNCVYHLAVPQKTCVWFDKTHATLLTEYLPWWAHISCIKNLYGSSIAHIEPSHNVRPQWFLGQEGVVPYVCSELFFHTRALDSWHETPIIALCNDCWAPRVAQQELLLAACVRACAWKRDIIYCSYGYAQWITSDGNLHPLAAVP
jgi:hypothetical protein